MDRTYYILHDGPLLDGTGYWKIGARQRLDDNMQRYWQVSFTRRGNYGVTLDRIAAWLPASCSWNDKRWFPSQRQVPSVLLEQVEGWLKDRELTATEAP
jgi:hypothetical protein